MSLSSPQAHTPTKGRFIGGSPTGGYGSPLRPRFERDEQSLPTVAEDGSNGSASTDSHSVSGGSSSQLSYTNAMSRPLNAPRGPVNSQMPHAKQQLPTTPQRAHPITVNGNMPPSLASPSFTLPQGAQQYGDYTQKMAPAKTNYLKDIGSQRGISHTGQRSDNWRSSGHASFSKSKRHPSTMVNPAPAFPRTMTDIPEYLAVQEMAFRQGQYDSGNSRSRVPASPFASLFDQVWERFFQMGAAYGGTPATSPVEPYPTHENFVWSILTNPATQDLEHLNGSVDMGWAHKMCSMSLNCMEELIRVVRNRPKDWEKIVCDIPFPVKQTIVAFPDLCEYYEALQQEANDAFGGGF